MGHKAVHMVGMDVGSTTVKAVIVETEADKMIWQDYQRHETKSNRRSCWNFSSACRTRLGSLRTTAASSSPAQAVAR